MHRDFGVRANLGLRSAHNHLAIKLLRKLIEAGWRIVTPPSDLCVI